MPVRGHPVDLVADRVPAGFDPSSGEVRRLMRFEHHIVGRIIEQLLDIGIHGGPVLLQRHAIIAAAVNIARAMSVCVPMASIVTSAPFRSRCFSNRGSR